jgi:predicted DNA-binding transcriptional regulator AlpA
MNDRIEQHDRTGERLLDVRTVAGMLNCSPRQIWRMSGETGRMPKPIKLCGLRRWNRAALEQWLLDGCPDLREEAKQ